MDKKFSNPVGAEEKNCSMVDTLNPLALEVLLGRS